MKFESFYSSSKANFYTVTAANGKRLLIECGCTWKQLMKALNYKLDNIVGCLLTHEHKDHSKAVEDVLNAGIDVYASAGTFKAIEDSLHLHRLAYIIEDRKLIRIENFNVLPFTVKYDAAESLGHDATEPLGHDAAEPLGFVIKEHPDIHRPVYRGGLVNVPIYLLFVTDTSHIKAKFGLAFNIIAICCNYDKNILQAQVKAKTINETFANRLLISHMDRNVTKSYIRDCCCLDRCTEIHLLHMSGSNIDKEAVREEFEKEFMVKTIIAGT